MRSYCIFSKCLSFFQNPYYLSVFDVFVFLMERMNPIANANVMTKANNTAIRNTAAGQLKLCKTSFMVKGFP